MRLISAAMDYLPALLLAAAALLAVAAVALRGVHSVRSQIFGRSIYRLPGSAKRLALTFDDGPSESTPAVLALLARHGVRATFFFCGQNVERLPGVARLVRDAGHEIGNHTQTHMRLCPRLGFRMNFRSPRTILLELEKTQRAIQQATDLTPQLFRAPYGLRWFGLRRAQRQLGLLGVMWTVIGHDWEWPAERIAQHVLQGASAGGILCLHDGRDIRPDPDLSQMLQALDHLLPELKRRGFQFTPVSEALRPVVPAVAQQSFSPKV